jgi:hypothetical protein
MAVALRAVADQLRDREAERAAGRALALVRSSFDGERWGPQFDLLGGNAGIALGALHLGDVELAELAVTPYLRTAEAGVTWRTGGACVRDGTTSHTARSASRTRWRPRHTRPAGVS